MHKGLNLAQSAIRQVEMYGGMVMKIVIDRIEAEYAVVELPDGSCCNMPKCLVPDGAGEGCVIDISYDNVETDERRSRIRHKMDNLFNR